MPLVPRFRTDSLRFVAALFAVGTILVGLTACGGDDSPTAPVGSYTLTAGALTPGSIAAGKSATSVIQVVPASGFTGSVTLSCGAIAGGTPPPTCSFSPASVTISGTTAVSSTLTVSTSSSTPGGHYTISVSGTGTNQATASNGAQTLALTTVTGPTYTLTAAALTPGAVTAGKSASTVIQVAPANGYSGSVSLSCSAITGGTPAPSCTFSPASVTIAGASTVNSTLTVSTASGTPGGRYTITVTGSDANKVGPLNGPVQLSVTLTAYSLTAAALNPAVITAGESATAAIEVVPAYGYTGSVSLSCAMIAGGTPAPSCSFSPASVTIGGVNPVTATLTLSTSTSTPGGSYAITVTGSDANKLAPSNGAQMLTLTAAAVIQHIVIIIQENRTPDNLFQDPVLISRGADIATSGVNSLGQTIPLSPMDLGTTGANPQNYDLSHAHKAFVAMYDGGKMDGADKIVCSPATECPPNANPNPQFKYVKPADVQPYFAMAEQYTFGDRMFETNEGPSFPAHQFILAGTSAPTATSSLFAAENPDNGNLTGCIGALTNTVYMINAAGSESAQAPEYTCYEHQTVTDLLDAKGVTWRYYTPSAGSIWTAPDAINHICQPQSVNGTLTCTGPIWTGNVVIPQTPVLTDIASGQLAQVSWVIPGGLESDHALANDGSGPAWVASVVNAIGKSAYWANTAIIIAWDDWGGWYDHVAPFKVIDDGVSWGSGYVYGFRVPLIVVSPYAKAAYISHTTHDFGSILKYIETTFNLPSLGYADTPADDMSDCFTLTQTPIAFKAIPAPLDAAYFLNDKRPPTDPDDD